MVIPEIVKPVPVTVAALMVRGAVPDEVSWTCWVVVVFRLTLPKATEVDASLSPGAAAPRLIGYVAVTLPA